MPGRQRSYRSRHRRYRRAQRLGALVGTVVGMVLVFLILQSLRQQNLQPTPLFLGAAMLLLLCCGGLPWLLVEMLWRWRSRAADDG